MATVGNLPSVWREEGMRLTNIRALPGPAPESVVYYQCAAALDAARYAARDLKEALETLSDRGAVILLPNGDELALTPEAIDAHLTNYAERCQEAADEAYYGGDGPPGCYGPDDKRDT